MASSLESVQEAIIAYLESEIPQEFVEQSVPDINNVKRFEGKIDPYVAYQFGDIGPGRAKSMIGPMGHDYFLPFRTQVVAGDAGVARRIANRITMAIIGASFPWSGSVTKNRAGGMWPLVNSNNAVEAYIFPAGFEVLIQLSPES